MRSPVVVTILRTAVYALHHCLHRIAHLQLVAPRALTCRSVLSAKQEPRVPALIIPHGRRTRSEYRLTRICCHLMGNEVMKMKLWVSIPGGINSTSPPSLHLFNAHFRRMVRSDARRTSISFCRIPTPQLFVPRRSNPPLESSLFPDAKATSVSPPSSTS